MLMHICWQRTFSHTCCVTGETRVSITGLILTARCRFFFLHAVKNIFRYLFYHQVLTLSSCCSRNSVSRSVNFSLWFWLIFLLTVNQISTRCGLLVSSFCWVALFLFAWIFDFQVYISFSIGFPCLLSSLHVAANDCVLRCPVGWNREESFQDGRARPKTKVKNDDAVGGKFIQILHKFSLSALDIQIYLSVLFFVINKLTCSFIVVTAWHHHHRSSSQLGCVQQTTASLCCLSHIWAVQRRQWVKHTFANWSQHISPV